MTDEEKSNLKAFGSIAIVIGFIAGLLTAGAVLIPELHCAESVHLLDAFASSATCPTGTTLVMHGDSRVLCVCPGPSARPSAP